MVQLGEGISRRFLPQRNAKNKEHRDRNLWSFFFAILAIFCGNSFLVAALPLWAGQSGRIKPNQIIF
jgi:hypothetical protein